MAQVYIYALRTSMGNNTKANNDAARCVATSSKKRENRVETSAFGAQ